MNDEGKTKDKVWGKTTCIAHRNGVVKVDVLSANAGWRSSRHRHPNWGNRFHVLSGVFRVIGDGHDVTMGAGQTWTVGPGEWHEFRCIDSGQMIEVYYLDEPGEDIERDPEQLGGQTPR
jgi:quercetin dioxygenase-like cupin family protein